MKYENLIVGGGITGAVEPRILADRGEDVLIVDQRPHIGGNCYDHWDENGICVHDYGTHIFHTDNREVWDFVSRFTKWYPYQHRVRALVDGMEVPVPFNLNAIRQVFPEKTAERLEAKLLETFGFNVKVPILKLRETGDPDLLFLAEYIYEKIFLFYTQKQWDLLPEELDPAVTGRVPVYISKDDRYFQNRYQGIPLEGYTAMFSGMLDHPKITVQLNTAFADIGNDITWNRLFYTGPIDEFFGYELGELPYRSEKFDFLTVDRPYFQSGAVINYPGNYTFTRIGEYKYFLDTLSDKTVVSYEYPQPFVRGINERYYPIVNERNRSLYEKYLKKAAALKNTWFLGRLGDYKYYDMDKAIERAMQLMKEIK